MLFSSTVFLYFFLPIVLLITALTPKSLKNYTLLLASLIFYAWGGIYYVFIMIFSITLNFIIGLKFTKYDKDERKRKRVLIIAVILNLLVLVIFKYTNFIVENLNIVFSIFHFKLLPTIQLKFPIGISFFTFHAMSYMIDIYRREAEVQKKYTDLALYISLFPQLVAGPIIRYHDVASQLTNRTVTLEKFKSGVQRFLIGLARKVLIANTFGNIVDDIFKLPATELSIPIAWLGIIAYAIQIYFDFSGYSDMAIGLGRMFGFEFLENFNFPYIAKNIKEFWRRWHISLSNWFRDYLYISLGGNRGSKLFMYRNLLIVFFLTGLWHGASWSFVVWGLFHGFFLVIERMGLDKILSKFYAPFQHFYTLLVVLLGWVFFRADSLTHALDYLSAMFGLNHISETTISLSDYVNNEIYIMFVIAILGSTTFFIQIHQKYKLLEAKMSKNTNIVLGNVFETIANVFFIFLLLASTMFLLANTYNPFIYFRF
jgi:alginate O-acetyltransferase complex protein AlgI